MRIPAWNCTTTSATDQRTNQHTAPTLNDCTPIGREYTAIGGPGERVLGEQRTPELGTPAPGGTYQLFDFGSIYHSPGTGAHEVHGRSWRPSPPSAGRPARWATPRRTNSAPPTVRGRFNHFEKGSVYWTRRPGRPP